nr:unnamed protein product [Callosobruchus chinensis]
MWSCQYLFPNSFLRTAYILRVIVQSKRIYKLSCQVSATVAIIAEEYEKYLIIPKSSLRDEKGLRNISLLFGTSGTSVLNMST